MKKKVLKILALIVALALIVGICWVANGLNGNPISKIPPFSTIVQHRA